MAAMFVAGCILIGQSSWLYPHWSIILDMNRHASSDVVVNFKYSKTYYLCMLMPP